MKTKIITILLVAFSLFSCKQENKTIETIEKKEEVSKVFKITLDAIVNKDDSFHLYYTEDGSTNFTEENSVWCEFKGNPNNQEIVFNLPENTIPTQIRLDFGVNKDQENITFKTFKMEYLGKKFEALSVNIFNYFQPNLENTDFDKKNGVIIPKKNGEKYIGPSLYPLPPLMDEIAKLVK